jgi:hypothetical protein
MAKTVRYVPTFRAPSEYERQVEEARRRAALAEALAQQQYEPMEGNAAPIPKAAPLVKALQGFMTARAGRQAEESKAEAEKAGRTEFADYIRSFDPEQRNVNMAQLAAMEAPMPMINTEPGGGPAVPYGQPGFRSTEYAQPSAIAAPNQRLMPVMGADGQPDFSQPMQMQVGGPLTAAQKRARALEGFESGNPMVQQFAAAQYEKTMPRELDLKLAPLDPTKVDMASVVEAQRTGDIGRIKARPEAPETMTPYQKEQIRLEEEKLAFQKTKAGQASERGKAPSGYRYDENSELEPIPGGPQDPTRPMNMPATVRTQIVSEQDNSRQFAIASQRTNKFIKDIQDGKLPLYKGAGVIYAAERAFGGDETYDEDTRPAYDRYYELERFVTEQVNMILSRAKGPQTDQDALRARQQILDNLDNKQVVTTALKTLDRLWNDEINLSESTIDDWYSQYNQSRKTDGIIDLPPRRRGGRPGGGR